MRKHKKDLILAVVSKMIDIVEVLVSKDLRIADDNIVAIFDDIYHSIIVVEHVFLESDEGIKINFNEAKNEIEYLIFNENDRTHEMNMEYALNALLGSLKNIRIELDDKVICKKEILFMPYQVSMWDSLESIWFAAKEDLAVECLVMPIPYYEVINGNELGQMHYDGNRFPGYVPITNYRDYDFEEHMPDVVFIHNPYDQCNYVTRVPERFYSSNIKKYTKNLVYVPYYVTEEDGPSDLSCIMPGVLYSDYVIVQPNRIYEKFSRIYTEYLKQNSLQNRFRPAEEKFLPLGSPKFDKILNTRIEIKDLPIEWRKKILKKDGSFKKIIFYNITVASLLENDDKIIKKIDSVLSAFSRKKDDWVLLWRPHPLLLNTINSMRPKLKEMYLKRVQQFKEEDWGIFDETPDPDMAMALSDAYYGDMSSLITVYKVTGKPILIQNINLLDDEIVN